MVIDSERLQDLSRQRTAGDESQDPKRALDALEEAIQVKTALVSGDPVSPPTSSYLLAIPPIWHAQRPVAGLSLLQGTLPIDRDRPCVALPDVLTGMRVHCLLAFACWGHYHTLVEGPKE